MTNMPPPPVKSAEAISKEIEIPKCIHTPLPPTIHPKFSISIATDIGGRKYQEDRFTYCPQLLSNRSDCCFFGVFDGTVGDYASDTVKGLVVPHLLNSQGWRSACELLETTSDSREAVNHMPSLLEQAIVTMYKNADDELVYMCGQNQKDYASSTSVTAVMAGGFLAVGHLGDSRVALGSERNGGSLSEFLTSDHKPDQLHEKERILGSGGTVEYLHNHNNKPFIRGGDFTARKSRGEQPMQLQYSRAFGGKDLKRFGLSNECDVRIVPLEPQHRCIILASDGLWDVMSSQEAVEIAMKAVSENKSPAELIVNTTLAEQRSRNQSADNITAMVIILNR